MQLKQGSKSADALPRKTATGDGLYDTVRTMGQASLGVTEAVETQKRNTVIQNARNAISVLPARRRVVQAITLGALQGIIACIALAVQHHFMFQAIAAKDKAALNHYAAVFAATTVIAFLVLPMATTAWQGWRERDWLRGVILNFALGMTMLTVVLVGSVLLPARLPLPDDPIVSVLSRFTVALVLMTGAIGAQARELHEQVALRRKANR